MTSQLKTVSAYLERQPGQPGNRNAPDMLPLSLEDLDRAQRWLAGTASPNPGDLFTEADVCRQTLSKSVNSSECPRQTRSSRCYEKALAGGYGGH